LWARHAEDHSIILESCWFHNHAVSSRHPGLYFEIHGKILGRIHGRISAGCGVYLIIAVAAVRDSFERFNEPVYFFRYVVKTEAGPHHAWHGLEPAMEQVVADALLPALIDAE
jgi:hypothetical protein